MTIKLIIGAALITTVAATTGVFATGEGTLNAPLQVPENPAVELPIELIYARAFELATPAVHAWRAERPIYTDGVLVVLEIEADWLASRQTAEPVIYVGDQTLDRINVGHPSGHLVGIVPGITLDELADAPIFFGQATLPESVDQVHIDAELNAARTSGLRGPGEERVTVASAQNDAPITAVDLGDLYFNASYLIEEYAPTEKDLFEGLRVPRGYLTK
ncbi:MAG: hypothetical protein ACJAVJ_000190 [Planctomycetota bacterium]|jgi:hypothetical protein